MVDGLFLFIFFRLSRWFVFCAAFVFFGVNMCMLHYLLLCSRVWSGLVGSCGLFCFFFANYYYFLTHSPSAYFTCILFYLRGYCVGDVGRWWGWAGRGGLLKLGRNEWNGNGMNRKILLLRSFFCSSNVLKKSVDW
ncbi:hypothetical protein BDD12DRAFT_184288 [Trichophaea hybrida]|nr:hypothetical protein BDD12DRAFT_184288 [Trichophaea hybrida]